VQTWSSEVYRRLPAYRGAAHYLRMCVLLGERETSQVACRDVKPKEESRLNLTNH
jgi:hypothetical protein